MPVLALSLFPIFHLPKSPNALLQAEKISPPNEEATAPVRNCFNRKAMDVFHKIRRKPTSAIVDSIKQKAN
jgi:hypothetical protein